MHDPRILQVMPGDGWRAALLALDYDVGGPGLLDEPLVAWALVDDGEGDTDLQGLVRLPGQPSFIARCRAMPAETRDYDAPLRFLGYLRPGEDANTYREEANETYARWREGEKGARNLLDAGWVLQESASYGRRWRSPDGREMDPRKALAELRGGEGKG